MHMNRSPTYPDGMVVDDDATGTGESTEGLDSEPVEAMGPNLPRIDLHAHTCFSLYDGVLTPDELVDAAVAAGLSGIAVTDHYDYDSAWQGGFIARRHARARGDITVWPGIEYAIDKGPHRGHMLVYFDHADDVPPRGLTAAELFDHCTDHELLTIHPHPFSAFGIPDHHMIARSPFVELNGDHGDGGPNMRVRREAARHGWNLVASSDAHDIRQLGSAWTEVRAIRDSLAATLAPTGGAGPRAILAGSPVWGIVIKTARVALAPVTLPWNAARALGAAWKATRTRALGRAGRVVSPVPGVRGTATAVRGRPGQRAGRA